MTLEGERESTSMRVRVNPSERACASERVKVRTSMNRNVRSGDGGGDAVAGYQCLQQARLYS